MTTVVLTIRETSVTVFVSMVDIVPIDPVPPPAPQRARNGTQRTQRNNIQSRRFCFTCNNYDERKLELFRNLGQKAGTTYLIVGKEVGDGGTPHLQGFVIFAASKRFNALIRDFPGTHWEAARGTSDQASTYCRKDGDFEEFGTLPQSQGRRTDVDQLVEWVDSFTAEHDRAPSNADVAKEQPGAFLRYRHLISELARLRAPPPVLRTGTPRDWQIRFEERLAEPADDRQILFFVDREGGTGKSWFQGYYVSKYPDLVQLLGVGKRDDVAHAVDPTKRIFFFNVPRDAMQFLQYTIFEQLKDRCVFSTKYQSGMKILVQTPHVAIFCNEEPDLTKMSADRYVIEHL